MIMVYKILRETEWAAGQKAGTFGGSLDDLRDGFIHFSAADQLRATAEKHFVGENALILLAIDAERLGADLRWEVSRGGQKFPHLYAGLPLNLVQWCREIHRGPDGRCIFPPGVP
jgi:uncharacterized protein (DUF952 family)